MPIRSAAIGAALILLTLPACDWRYLQPSDTSMVFTAWFSPADRVLRTGSSPDPEATENRGGR